MINNSYKDTTNIDIHAIPWPLWSAILQDHDHLGETRHHHHPHHLGSWRIGTSEPRQITWKPIWSNLIWLAWFQIHRSQVGYPTYSNLRPRDLTYGTTAVTTSYLFPDISNCLCANVELILTWNVTSSRHKSLEGSFHRKGGRWETAETPRRLHLVSPKWYWWVDAGLGGAQHEPLEHGRGV